jgi:hypothetical protein
VVRVLRPRTEEFGRAALNVDGTQLSHGRNRHLVADAQGVAVGWRCFRGGCRSQLPNAEADGGGGRKDCGQKKYAACFH